MSWYKQHYRVIIIWWLITQLFYKGIQLKTFQFSIRPNSIYCKTKTSICSKHLLFSWKKSCFALHILLQTGGATWSGHSSGRRGRWWHPTPPGSRSTSTHPLVLARCPKTYPRRADGVPKPLAEALELLVSSGWAVPGTAKGGVWYTSLLPGQNAGTNMSLLRSMSTGDSGDPSGAFLHELWRRWRRNILFASILASQWSWVTLLLTQGHSGSLRISDPTGQDQSRKQHFIQGWLGSLRITPIGWVGSWHWKTVGWSQIWDMEPTSTLTTPEKRPVGSFIS